MNKRRVSESYNLLCHIDLNKTVFSEKIINGFSHNATTKSITGEVHGRTLSHREVRAQSSSTHYLWDNKILEILVIAQLQK